ncbi:hypothetical protein DFH29DRAFT_877627 [Suillus ampliporus]|nr:hypothetical protein DFH29DRAFT_877627 [Suillus ampliporus]
MAQDWDSSVFGNSRAKAWRTLTPKCQEESAQSSECMMERYGVIIATNNAGPMILHQLDDAVCIRTYNTNPVKTFPKQVVFGEKTDVVVGGSDAGVIYIFDKNEGTLKQVLKHADKARVQTVIVRIIVGATSQNDTEPVISIWSHQRDNLETPRPLGRALKNFVRGIVQLAIVIALLTYVSHVISHKLSFVRSVTTYPDCKSLGNIWQNLARPHDPMNHDIRVWVEQYIEHRGEMVVISDENRIHTG